MKVITAIDSFKGSLTSVQAGYAVESGIKKVFPDAEVFVLPVADGGEGTVSALVEGLNGKMIDVEVSDPLGRRITAQYGIVNGDTAVIEMSAAAGITLVSENERNPMNTTTYGVGEMIADAVNKGYRNFIIGIGGSATNDGGAGMLQALGFEFSDSDGKSIEYGAKGLEKLCKITGENVMPQLSECVFRIACDVTNPLCGENGCSAVFAPQKGADKQAIEKMDKWLENYALLATSFSPDADKNAAGAGAAGGLGFAFMTFLNAKLKNGIELILSEIQLEKYIKDADFVITGEGRLDSQTVMGKAPSGVASIAKKYDVPVIAFAGSVTEEAVVCNQHGIDAFFPILRSVCLLDEAMNTENAYKNMSATAEQVFRLLKLLSP